jgi:hypothetical protein
LIVSKILFELVPIDIVFKTGEFEKFKF